MPFSPIDNSQQLPVSLSPRSQVAPLLRRFLNLFPPFYGIFHLFKTKLHHTAPSAFKHSHVLVALAALAALARSLRIRKNTQQNSSCSTCNTCSASSTRRGDKPSKFKVQCSTSRAELERQHLPCRSF